jgi:hypothetical protein
MRLTNLIEIIIGQEPETVHIVEQIHGYTMAASTGVAMAVSSPPLALRSS